MAADTSSSPSSTCRDSTGATGVRRSRYLRLSMPTASSTYRQGTRRAEGKASGSRRPAALSEADIQKMVKGGPKTIEEDKRRKELVEARNQADAASIVPRKR